MIKCSVAVLWKKIASYCLTYGCVRWRKRLYLRQIKKNTFGLILFFIFCKLTTILFYKIMCFFSRTFGSFTIKSKLMVHLNVSWKLNCPNSIIVHTTFITIWNNLMHAVQTCIHIHICIDLFRTSRISHPTIHVWLSNLISRSIISRSFYVQGSQYIAETRIEDTFLFALCICMWHYISVVHHTKPYKEFT